MILPKPQEDHHTANAKAHLETYELPVQDTRYLVPGIMERAGVEPIWLCCPGFADELVGCEASQGLQPACEVVGLDEISEVVSQLVVGLVEVAFDGGVFDGAVHPFDLAVIRHDDPDAQIPGRPLCDGAMVRPSVHGALGARECGQADP